MHGLLSVLGEVTFYILILKLINFLIVLYWVQVMDAAILSETLSLLFSTFAVALGMPSVAPQHPVKHSSEEEQEKPSPVSVDREQSQSLGELEHEGGVKTAETEADREPALRAGSPVNAGPEVKAEPEAKEEPVLVRKDTPGKE